MLTRAPSASCGTDIREFSRTDVRNQFGMVLQDTWLFNGTVRDNIAYGKLDATDAEVEAAARAAYVHHFITHVARMATTR